MHISESSALERAPYQNIGLLLGPAIFLLMMLFDGTQTVMDQAAWRVAAVGLWMAAWWATEAISVPITAFLPMVMFPFLDVASM